MFSHQFFCEKPIALTHHLPAIYPGEGRLSGMESQIVFSMRYRDNHQDQPNHCCS